MIAPALLFSHIIAPPLILLSSSLYLPSSHPPFTSLPPQPLPSPHPPPLATSPYLRGSVAYCSQVPWIVEGTIRDNVLFGRPYEEEWYWRVVRSCCLTEDLEMLPAGDMTEVR